MKRSLSLLAMVLALGLSTAAMDAEAARRMGSGKSVGMQRDVAPPARTPNATPAQTPATTPAAAPAAAAAAAPAAAAASSSSKWLGPIAGLAAGIGLMALASHFGFGEALANMLMIGLLIMAVLAVVGFILRKRAMAKMGGAAGAGGMAYAGAAAGASGSAPAYQTAMPAAAPVATPPSMGGSMIGAGVGAGAGSAIGAGVAAAPAGRIPADFDVAGFVRNAKVNFIRLQAANDAGNLDDLRQFTTPEMFAELRMDLVERGSAAQHTDVVRIEGDVIDVEENADGYVVSVRFTGETRDSGSTTTEAFDEIWHLTKPRQGNSGWLLAGIQQMQ